MDGGEDWKSLGISIVVVVVVLMYLRIGFEKLNWSLRGYFWAA